MTSYLLLCFDLLLLGCASSTSSTLMPLRFYFFYFCFFDFIINSVGLSCSFLISNGVYIISPSFLYQLLLPHLHLETSGITKSSSTSWVYCWVPCHGTSVLGIIAHCICRLITYRTLVAFLQWALSFLVLR